MNCPMHQTPPYPKPKTRAPSLLKRFFLTRYSWIHALQEKSYTMKMGHIRFPSMDAYVVNDPKWVEEMLVKRPLDFPKHNLQHDILKPLLGDSVFTTNGAVWERQRKMINPAFSHTRLKKSYPTMMDAIGETMTDLQKTVGDKAQIDIEPVMTHITADIIFRTILSVKMSPEDSRKILENFNIFQDLTQKSITLKTYNLPHFYGRRIQKAANNILDVLRPIIAQRYKNPDKKHDDILQNFMQAKDKNSKHFSVEECTNQVAMLFLAGHETTASALTWSLYLLATHPEYQDKIRKEVQDNVKGKKIPFENIKNLKTTLHVFEEAMRLYPPVSFFPRRSKNRPPCAAKKSIQRPC